MDQLLRNIQEYEALIIAAPPGWGKTYKILDAIEKLKKRVLFVFPLRALCDEVFYASKKRGINVANLQTQKDLEPLDWNYFNLVTTTPECLSQISEDKIPADTVIIFDECHLIYYWGESFREGMLDCYLDLLSTGRALILLSATLSPSILDKLQLHLEFMYDEIFFCNFGNQKLKNDPAMTYHYPKFLKKMMMKDLFFSQQSGVKLVFCKFRQEVEDLVVDLERFGHEVLSCIGGESAEFTKELQSRENSPPDYIVATSVVSHGVNLPAIKSIYFLYDVDNPDFYLQMIGRGGRDGSPFNVHTMKAQKLKLKTLFEIFVKNISNTLTSYLYYLDAR